MSRRYAVAAVAALALALTACSGGGDSGSTAAPQTLTPPPGTVLSPNSTAKLGTVVIDGVGWTMYRSDADSAAPPTATCVDACTTAWLPVLAEPGAPLTADGLDATTIGTVERPDGDVQVTLHGWPLYRCAADPQTGAVDCHGRDGFHAITPEGEKAEPTA